MAEVFDLTFDSASDEDCAPADCAAPGYKNHNAPGRREAPEAPRRRSVPTKRFSEEYAPPRGDVDEDDNEPSKPKRRRTKPTAAPPAAPPVAPRAARQTAPAAARPAAPPAAPPVVDAGVDVHTVDLRWATHNLPGRGCGGRMFHHPTLSAVGRGRGGCSVKCEIVLDRLANVCRGLRRAYEFGYQWHRKPSGQYHHNTFSLPGEKKKPDAGYMIRHIKELEHHRREELGVCFETWLAAGGYFPPFRASR